MDQEGERHFKSWVFLARRKSILAVLLPIRYSYKLHYFGMLLNKSRFQVQCPQHVQSLFPNTKAGNSTCVYVIWGKRECMAGCI